MTRGYRDSTIELADVIEDDFLKFGGGNLNPTIDQIVRAWQDRTGLSLAECIDFVDRRLRRALDCLAEQRQWAVWVPYSAAFLPYAKRNEEPDADTEWPDLLATVAVTGRSTTAGIHFHVPTSVECMMYEVYRDWYDKVGNGFKRVSRESLDLVLTDRLQPAELTDRMVAARTADTRSEAREWKRIGASVPKIEV